MFYCYKVKYFEDGTCRIEEGIVTATDQVKAMGYLVDRFGWDTIEVVKLAEITHEIGDENILPLEEFDANYDTFIKNDNW